MCEARKFQVSADVKFLDGLLAGLTVPGGQTCTFPDAPTARRHAVWLHGLWTSRDFARSVGTGARFIVVSCPQVREVA